MGISRDHVRSPQLLQRFESEARAAAALRSRHVVDVLNHDIDREVRRDSSIPPSTRIVPSWVQGGAAGGDTCNQPARHGDGAPPT